MTKNILYFDSAIKKKIIVNILLNYSLFLICRVNLIDINYNMNKNTRQFQRAKKTRQDT